jgi:hypothetical protein
MASSSANSNPSDHTHALTSIRKKFRTAGVKVSGIVSKCQKIDRNHDYSVHIDDLEDIIQDSLKDNGLTRRELNILFGLITHDKRRGKVEYERLFEILEGKSVDNKDEDRPERWFEPGSERSTMKRGSIGEYLESAACPAEVDNFKKFIACLEMYERSSGMRIKHAEDGFVVPLGPDISVNVQFVMPK